MLIKGDCFKLLEAINSKGVDYVLTSPPYNRKRNDKYTEYNDNIENYYDFLVSITDILLDKTRKYVFMNLQANYYNRKDIYKYIGNYADKIQNIIVWEKSNPTPAAGNSITNAYEYIIVLGDSPLKSNTTYTKNHLTTNVCKNEYTKVHKAVMNEEVSDWLIEKFTQEGEIILDPFMGTGTTGVSCKKFNRKFIGMEMVTDYFKIAYDRIYNEKEKSA